MAAWKDQEPFNGEVLIDHIKIGDLLFEVERSYDSDEGYRITGGNLFKSQSIHVNSARAVLRFLGEYAKAPRHVIPFEALSKLPGFIKVEKR